MKNNSKRRSGFTLIEVIISMALIAILSIGAYNSYLMIIKITKGGEVKQSAALAGKKTLEVIKSIDDFTKSGKDILLSLDNNDVMLKYGSDEYKATEIKLDKDFQVCSDQSNTNADYAYIQSISLTPIKADGQNINIDKNDDTQSSSNTNVLEYELSIERNGSDYLLRDKKNNKTSPLTSLSDRVSIYLDSNNLEKKITIKDSDGNRLLDTPIELGEVLNDESKKNEIRLNINFSKYSGANLKDVKIYVYNKNEEKNCITNIYLQKSQNLNVDVKVNEGKAYIYNNRAEDPSYKIGDLYDIKTEIKNKDDETLFTGYSNQNININ